MLRRLGWRDTLAEVVRGSFRAKAMRKCDIVMKGGITSGIVFPSMVSVLAQHFRFQSIGGTSAGGRASAGQGSRRSAPWPDPRPERRPPGVMGYRSRRSRRSGASSASANPSTGARSSIPPSFARCSRVPAARCGGGPASLAGAAWWKVGRRVPPAAFSGLLGGITSAACRPLRLWRKVLPLGGAVEGKRRHGAASRPASNQ
jgi:hypothetical protein